MDATSPPDSPRPLRRVRPPSSQQRFYADKHPARTARIAAAYTEGEGAASIAKREGVTEVTVRRALRRSGVVMRPPGKPRTCAVNERYFERVEDEARAYWLGFLLADGCVTNGALRVRLAERDRAHLEALRAAMGSTHAITEVTGGGFKADARHVDWAVKSKVLCEGLGRWGVVPRKSGHEVAPELPHELVRHFWRGVLDGDGWVCRSGRKWFVGITGSAALCQAFGAYVRGVLPETRAEVRANGTARKFQVSGTTGPRELLRVLYEGAAVALPRKAEKARECIAEV